MKVTLDQLKPTVLSATGTQALPNDLMLENTVAQSYCLLYTVTGSLNILWNGKSFLIPENAAFLFLPGYLYTLSSEDQKLKLIDIRFDLLLPDTEENTQDPKISASLAHCFSDYKILNEPFLIYPSSQLKRTMEELILEKQKPLMFSEEIANLYLQTVLLCVIRDALTQEEDKLSDAAAKIMQYVHAHILENIQNESIAKELSYHPNYINRVIKKATGMTFHKYVVNEKMHHAASLLLNTNESITSIAYSLSFNTSSHFGNLFAQKYKCTPTQYRKYRLTAINTKK